MSGVSRWWAEREEFDNSAMVDLTLQVRKRYRTHTVGAVSNRTGPCRNECHE